MSVSSLSRRFLLFLVPFCFSVVLLAPFSSVSAIDRENKPSGLEKDEGEVPESIQDEPNIEKSATDLRKERRDANRKAATDRAKKAVALNEANAAKKKAKEEQVKKKRREKKIAQHEKSIGENEKGYFLIQISTIRHQMLKTTYSVKPVRLPVVDFKLIVANGRRAAAEEIVTRLDNIKRQRKPRGNPLPSPQRRCKLLKRYSTEKDANAAKMKDQAKLDARAKKINEEFLTKKRIPINKKHGLLGAQGPV